MRRRGWRGIFYWVDTVGLPLEVVLAALLGKTGDTPAGLLRAFLREALASGWAPETAAAVVRELRMFGYAAAVDEVLG